ncbi:alpha/beta fold hydrolase [Agrobacterium tumefaciens]|uniref:Serine aminopeptidase S33 domain-containing protein n=1 Tax=Agrobacterium tumefaciens TaxID=358 RepID=A0A176XFG6_AGRTU|nr:alpha/beta fold hydrolase [Agrobacterium tumefaciens]OAE48361.1 hypothetical protein A7J57_22000 [Agrobacterium tumefaciens]
MQIAVKSPRGSLTFFPRALPLMALVFYALVCSVSVVTAQPYSKESELSVSYHSRIADFWNRHGERRNFIGLGGVRIATMTFPRPDSSAGIVISIGYGESFIKYREVIYDLWHAGFQIYILDHRGQGFSDRLVFPDKAQQSDPSAVKRVHDLGYVEHFEDYVADLKTFVDRAAKPRNRRLFLLGHSMGGAIGSLYLQTYSSDFSGAVFTAPMHQPDLSPVPNMACWLFRLGGPKNYVWGRGPFALSNDFDPFRSSTSSRVRYEMIKRGEAIRHPEIQLGGPSFNWVYESCLAANRSVRNAGKITTNVLLIQAGEDRVVKAAAQRTFCRLMNANRRDSCRLKRLDGAKHELLIERDEFRKIVLDETINFFERQNKE